MRLRLPDRDEKDERGAIAILTAFLAIVVMMFAALAVDVATQVNERQRLHDTIDAAAHAGAYQLPASGVQAQADALAFAAQNDPSTPPPAVDFFCVVAPLASGSTWIVDTTQIPSTCNPFSVKAGSSYTGYKCNSRLCSIPCNPAVGDLCNTVRVAGQKPVPFAFAPVTGIDQGTTGSVTSVACKGACGTIPPNPMDVAVVADRTGSMDSDDISAMITGIKGMFQVMTPSQQYVALGTIGRSSSSAPSTCKSSPSGSTTTSGPWVPVPFSADYLTAGTTTINTNSTLVKAVNCLTNSSSTGTTLASPMKYAARYLLGIDPPQVSLPARTGTVRKAIIFETDGQPNESAATGGDTFLTSGDVFSKTDRTMTVGSGTATRYYYNGGHMACENMKDVAAKAKAAGILVVTIAYNLGGKNCSESDKSADSSNDCKTLSKVCAYSKYATPTKVTDALAAAASPNTATGLPSVAQNDCTDQAKRDAENADGDFFFCGASNTVMAPIFKTALGQLAKGIRMIQLP